VHDIAACTSETDGSPGQADCDKRLDDLAWDAHKTALRLSLRMPSLKRAIGGDLFPLLGFLIKLHLVYDARRFNACHRLGPKQSFQLFDATSQDQIILLNLALHLIRVRAKPGRIGLSKIGRLDCQRSVGGREEQQDSTTQARSRPAGQGKPARFALVGHPSLDP